MTTLPLGTILRSHLVEAREAQLRLRAAEAEVSQQRAIFREAVRRAHAEGLSFQVIGEALGVTRKRVHQIVSTA